MPSTFPAAAEIATASVARFGEQHDRGDHTTADTTVDQGLQRLVRRARCALRRGVGLAELDVPDRRDEDREEDEQRLPPKSHGRRTIIRAHVVQPREAVPSLRMCGMSTRGPTVASRAGSSVSTTATLHSGMSIPPKPMLRSSGTGMTTSAIRLMATVTPDANTACPAVRIEMRTASSLSWPWAHLLAPAGHEEQGVVDRDTEADEGDEELHDEADVGEHVSSRTIRNVVRMETAAISSGTRASSEAKTNDEDREGSERAEQRLLEHARPAVVAPAGRQLAYSR